MRSAAHSGGISTEIVCKGERSFFAFTFANFVDVEAFCFLTNSTLLGIFPVISRQ
jgi:hypothetical protein